MQVSGEFRGCVRQLFRLQHRVGESMDNYNWEQWEAIYRHEASIYIDCINSLIYKHKEVTIIYMNA